ncbi:MAG: formimidoylglutamate deiminase [Bacteriovoracaceae bacterium]|jgi:formimidoylglutamate deiminase|nr:formimidoylglutamate deiminase [Bacteriovoracaceae bacterium]
MKVWKVDHLLLNKEWLSPAYIEVDDEGIVQKLSSTPIPEAVDLEGYLIPGFQNSHSHAFQYAFAGLTENLRDHSKDNFWSWREEMYKLALSMSPDKMKEVATKLYKECTRVGYTSIAEFHYLHHDTNGKPYNDPALMSLCLMEAAKEANIELTLIPIFYQKGGFGKDPLENQRRFISKTIDDYFRLVEQVEKHAKNYENVNHGIGIHSLRAVSGEDIIATFKQAPSELPKHIHIAEQVGEVEDCKDFYGKRPVQWLFENNEVDSTLHLVHATHVNEAECNSIVESCANVVLCPSTEANLGDGIFPLTDYTKIRGEWSIGTDSHIGLTPMEELRWLEYTQRLQSRSRNPLCENSGDDSGSILFHQSIKAGLKAMGKKDGDYFEIGKPFNGVLIDKNSAVISGKPLNKILSTLVFAGDRSVLKATFCRGLLNEDKR